MSKVRDAWARIEAWLEEHAPVVLDDLRPPASAATIRVLEQRLGTPLPEPYVESLLVHDGQAGDGPALWLGRVLLRVEDVLAEWRRWSERAQKGHFVGVCGDPDPGVRTDWFHPSWVPITSGAGGDHHCLDLAPTEAGQPGQVIELWHDQPTRAICAADFATFLARFATALESGRYAFSEHSHAIVTVEEASLAASFGRRNMAKARGRTALHEAIENGDRRRIDLLLEIGADLDAVWRRGPKLEWTPLHAAASTGDAHTLGALLRAGANPNPSTGMTSPLHTARSAEVVEVLVAAGADLECRDDLGRTPLHRAVETSDDLDLIRALLGAGARIDTQNRFGRALVDDIWVDAVRDLVLAKREAG